MKERYIIAFHPKLLKAASVCVSVSEIHVCNTTSIKMFEVMKSLEDRRQSLCLKFARKCLEVEKLRKMFPKKLKMHDMSKRNFEHHKVNRTLTKRYFNSAVPQMQRLLNSDKKKRVEILRKLSSYPVNNDFCKSTSLR